MKTLKESLLNDIENTMKKGDSPYALKYPVPTVYDKIIK